MSIGDKPISFKWSNYTKPTPANMERISSGIKDLLAGLTSVSVFSEQSYWVSGVLSILIVVVGQFTKFFASIAQEEKNK